MNMKKIKLLTVLIILSFISSFLYNIDGVNADISSSSAGIENGSTIMCKSGSYCYSVGTGGMRVALLGPDGKRKGKIVDYWFVNKQIEFYNAKTADTTTKVVTFKNKNMKQDLNGKVADISQLDFIDVNSFKFEDASENRYAIKRIETGPESNLRPIVTEHLDLPYEAENGLLYAMTQKFCYGASGLDPYEIHAKNNINEQPCVQWKKDGKILNSGIEVGGGTGYYIKSSVKLNVRNANAVETIINRIVANGRGESDYKGQGNFNTTKGIYLKNIFKDIGVTPSMEDYLQIEPLTQWGSHGNASGCDYGALVFIGTPSEFSFIINDLQKNYSSAYMDKFNSGRGGRGYYEGYLCAFQPYNASMYFHLVTYGVTTPDSNVIPNNIFNATKSSAMNSYNYYEFYKQGLYIANHPKDAFGVSFIKIKDSGIGSQCSDVAIKYLEGNNVSYDGLAAKLKKEGIQESNFSWIKKYSDYGFKDLKAVKNYLSSKLSTNSNCPEPTCDETAERLLSPSKGLNQAQIKGYLLYLYGNIKDGQTGAANLDAYFTNPKLYNNTKNLCGAQTCNDLLKNKVLSGSSYNESSLRALSSLFPNYALLDADLIKELEINPKCETVNPCLTTTSTPACNSHHSFAFEDANNTGVNSKCELGKYAYNYAKTNDKGEVVGDVVKASIQTSRDKAYGKEGYCREEVVFDFPRDVEKVTGGSIMKWGINNSKNSTLFGTMKARRTCFIDSENVASPFLIRSDWANIIDSKLDINHNGRINPLIKMYYKEAVEDSSKALTLSAIDMDTYLTKFTMKVVGGKGTGKVSSVTSTVEYDRAYNVIKGNREDTAFTDSYREFRCGGNCSTIYRVEMEADYEIDYPQRLKWYSDTGDNFKKKSAKDVEKSGVAEAKYVALGYGLPTSFLTPSSYGSWYGKSSKDSSGYMYVDLSQIGTKNNDGTYHFDKYTKYYVDGAYKYGEEKGKGSHIKYSCNYSIENILYDYECPDGSCDKKGKPTCEMVLGRNVCGAGRIPKGIDVVFRTVELIDTKSAETNAQKITRAFPGRSGSGRTIGDNWDFDKKSVELEAKIGEKNLGGKIITQLLNNNIYESSPKYVIDLNPVVIQDIRKENKKDSYTSMSEYIFKKHSSTRYTTSDWSKAINECKDDNKNGCRRMSFLYRTVNEANSINNQQLDYSYTYGASPFLSELMSKKRLTGTCAEEIDTGKRAETFAESYGC